VTDFGQNNQKHRKASPNPDIDVLQVRNRRFIDL